LAEWKTPSRKALGYLIVTPAPTDELDCISHGIIELRDEFLLATVAK